jgi:hypothetical protein
MEVLITAAPAHISTKAIAISRKEHGALYHPSIALDLTAAIIHLSISKPLTMAQRGCRAVASMQIWASLAHPINIFVLTVENLVIFCLDLSQTLC